MSTDFYGVSSNKCNCKISPSSITPMMKNDVEEFKNNNLIRANQFDGGCDIRSAETIVIKPHESVIIGTGLHTAIPNGYVGLVRGRSSLAFKHNVFTFHGTIDSCYRGEIKCILYNISNNPFKVNKGDRIAQMVTVPVNLNNYVETQDLPDPNDDRQGGFGSTGK